MDRLVFWFWIAVLACFIAVSFVHHFGRATFLLRRWAAQNGYRIVHRERRDFLRGPFTWTSGRGQTVYSVVVEDGTGSTHQGWVRCGSYWRGLWSDKVEVRWEARMIADSPYAG